MSGHRAATELLRTLLQVEVTAADRSEAAILSKKPQQTEKRNSV